MKILHTSDLHLGKNLLEESFFEDQKYILDEIIKIIKEEKVEAVLIPGDIYDKNIPSVDAVNLFNDFLNKLSNLKVETFITSGNHDSNDRLSFGSSLFNKLNIHIETEYSGKLAKYSMQDVDIYMLPFIKPFHLKGLMSEEEYEKIQTPTDMMKWVLANENIDKSKKNILLLHQFVINQGESLETSDSESSINVGTLDSIDVNTLDIFDYVAMGHIHGPQKVKRETVRYSGTPLKYSFSEVNQKKSVVIIDTEDMSIKLIPLKPLRNLRVIRGYFKDIMDMQPCDDLIRIELLDEATAIISPMENLKRRFKNAISLAFIDKNYNSKEVLNSDNLLVEEKTPIEIFSEFFVKQNNRELIEDENKILKEIIDEIEGEK